MGRLLVLIVIVVAVVWLLKRALAGPRPTVTQKPAVEGDLVSCARCGVHLPRAEARGAGERLYCSEEHARLGPRQPEGPER